MTINRSCYICHSLRYDRLYSSKNSLCCVFLIWMLTLVAIVPNLCVGTLQNDPRVYSCTFTQSVSSSYTIAVVAFHFIIPMLVVIFCYLRIWALVLQVIWRVKPGNKPKLKPQDFRNFVTMFVVFVLFTICWAPLNFIGLVLASDPVSMAPRIPRVAVCGQLLYGVFQQLPQCDHIWTTEPKFQAGIPKNYSLIVYHQDVLCG
uniref:Melatonin receptor type 1A n=1 Tax=Axis axis TaxID=30531 RepID=A0A5P9VKS9_AXIAX|nr:melatonin receptor 1a [Axis axis]